jgi:hypothetical protein
MIFAYKILARTLRIRDPLTQYTQIRSIYFMGRNLIAPFKREFTRAKIYKIFASDNSYEISNRLVKFREYMLQMII